MRVTRPKPKSKKPGPAKPGRLNSKTKKTTKTVKNLKLQPYFPVFKAAFLTTIVLSGTIIGSQVIHSGFFKASVDKISDSFQNTTSSWGFVVRNVYTQDRQRTNSVDIRLKIEGIYRQNILMVDISKMKRNLETLPWVRTATVRRQLPDTLLLILEETKPLALWQDEEKKLHLIGWDGKIVPDVDLFKYRAMPIVTGRGAPLMVAKMFEKLLEQPELARRVTGAQLVDERRWNVFIDGKIVVRMPAEGFDKALRKLSVAQSEKHILDKAVAAIDLRQPDWLVVELMEEVIDGLAGEAA